MRHPQLPADLRVAGAPRPQRAGLPPLRIGDRPRPARPRLPDQRRRPLPHRRVMQRGDVVLRKPQHRRHYPALEPELPQRRQRDVPHRGISGVVLEQDHRPGRDHAPAPRLVHPKVPRLWHAFQDRRNRR